MSQEDIIAKRYAKGLAGLAAEAGTVEEVGADLARLAGLVDPHDGGDGVPELMDFLNTPVMTPAAKLAATDAILEKVGIGKTVSDFLNVLIAHNRVGLLPQINRQFAVLAAVLTRERVAVVRTARPLSDDQAGRLADALSRALGAGVKIIQRVEPGLLAGARVEIDGKVVDGTALGKLERMRVELSKI